MLDLSDPYCTLGLHETEHRGATCRRTLNPTWEEEFEFRGTEDDLVRVKVRVRVSPNPNPNPYPNPNPSQVPRTTREGCWPMSRAGRALREAGSA